MRFRSMRPANTSYAMALFETVLGLLRMVLPTMLTVPEAVTGRSGDSIEQSADCRRGLRRHERRDDTRRCRCPRCRRSSRPQSRPGSRRRGTSAGSADDVALDDAVDVARRATPRGCAVSPRTAAISGPRRQGSSPRMVARARTPVALASLLTSISCSSPARRVDGKYRQPLDRQVHAASGLDAIDAGDVQRETAKGHRLGRGNLDRASRGSGRRDDDRAGSLACGFKRQSFRDSQRLGGTCLEASAPCHRAQPCRWLV